MDLLTVYSDAIKSDRLGSVKGYLVRFGSPDTTDLEGDYFTKSTDFGFPIKAGQRVPLNVYYHHGMDKMIGKKSIGTGYVKMDETGLWYEAQLDMADSYGEMIAKLCKQGKMGYSSGAAGHMVERKSVGKASEITRWCIAEASITPTPAEYRNSVKSLEDMYSMEPMEEEEMVMDKGQLIHLLSKFEHLVNMPQRI
jgi:HK97 family phage prohead protease